MLTRWYGLILAGLWLASPQPVSAEPDWPAPVANWQPVAAGEHPRLFFRKTDLPALRRKAQTPEG